MNDCTRFGDIFCKLTERQLGIKEYRRLTKLFDHRIPQNAENEVLPVVIDKLHKPKKYTGACVNMWTDFYYKNKIYRKCKIIGAHYTNNKKWIRFNISHNGEILRDINLNNNSVPARVYTKMRIYYRDPIYEIKSVLEKECNRDILSRASVISSINNSKKVCILVIFFLKCI